MDKETSIQRLLMQQMLTGSTLSLAITAFLAAILAYMHRNVIASTVVLSWLSVMGSITLFRAILVIAYKRDTAEDYSTVHARMLKYRFCFLLGGAAWGVAGIVMYPSSDPQLQMFIIFMLTGVTAGGAISYAADLPGAIGFSSLVLTPIILNLLISGDSGHMAMGLVSALYLGLMIMGIRHTNRNLIDNIILRLEAAINEESIRSKEERYRLLLTHAPVGICHYDTHLVITYCNERFANILHNSVEHLIGLDINAVTDHSILPALYKAIEGEIGFYEGKYVATHSNAEKWIYMTCAPSRDGQEIIVGGVAIVQDISERKQNETKVTIFRTLLDNSSDAIEVLDPDTLNILDMNETGCRELGYSLVELQSMCMPDIVPGFNALSAKSIDEKIHQTGHAQFEGMRLRKDGSTFPVEVSATYIKLDRPYMLGIVRDITKRKQAEELLRASEERFRLAETAAAVGTWEWDMKTNIAQYSDEYFRIIGIAPTSVGQTYAEWMKIIHPEDRDKAAADIRNVMENHADYHSEYRIVRPDGDIRWLESKGRMSNAVEGKQTGMIGAVIDITERKKAEQQVVEQLEHVAGINAQLLAVNKQLEFAKNQLLQSDKMAAIGLLAAGIAHEINNPVGYVNSNLSTLEKYLGITFNIMDKYEVAAALLKDDDPLKEELRQLRTKFKFDFIHKDIKKLVAESQQGLDRVTKIILDLKDFSHADSNEQWVWANVHRGLDSTLNVVWNELKYKCEVVKEYGTLPDIYCLPSQLNQVFMNILVNAAQAIEVRGKITLRTGQEGNRIWIDIIDTGQGIPAENIPHLYEPFFSTKPVGRGTGLGLAVSYSIVERHHGSIEVHSKVGEGSTFRVWLPVHQPDTKEAK